LKLVEVEDCAGRARDGASDDGHALCGQLGAGLGLEGRTQARLFRGRLFPRWQPIPVLRARRSAASTWRTVHLKDSPP